MEEKRKLTKKKIIILIIIIILVLGLGVGGFLFVRHTLNNMCPSGYEIETGWKCHKLIKAKPEVKYSCEEGYTLTKKTCTKTETVSPTIEYYCDDTEGSRDNVWSSASTLSGSICTFTINHYAVERKECPYGFWALNDSQCEGYMILDASYRETMGGYYCVDITGNGVIQDGSKCKHILYSSYNVYKVCLSDFALNGDICTKYESYDARYNIYCPSGYNLNGNTCTKTSAVEANIDYICEEEYKLSNGNCEKDLYVDANKPW